MHRLQLDPYIGKPFRSGGRGPEAYDCWGLVIAVYRDLYGIALPDYDIAASALRSIAGEIQAARDSAAWAPCAPDVEPAVVVMALHQDHPNLVNHCGVRIAGVVLHTVDEVGSHTFKLPSLLWGGRIKGYYRWTGNQITK